MVRFDGTLIEWIWFAVAGLWLVMAFRTKRTAARQSGSIRLIAVVIVADILITPPLQSPMIHHQLWSRSALAGLSFAGVVAAGAAVGVWARLTLAGNWSGAVTLKEDHELIQTGPYRLVRHPIYTALLLMGLGTALYLGQLYGFIIFGLSSALLVWKIRLEEKLMSAHFPTQYENYRRNVKALIPYIV